jgi:hypothetical protein
MSIPHRRFHRGGSGTFDYSFFMFSLSIAIAFALRRAEYRAWLKESLE